MGILIKVGVDKLRVDDNNINSIKINKIATDESLIREINIKAQDF